MSSPRVNFYGPVHKALRALLHDMVEGAGRTDYQDPAETAALGRRVDDAFAILRGHAHHEETFVGPLLRAHAPAVAVAIDHEHDGQGRRLDALRAQLSAAEGDPARGHAFTLALSRFVAETLAHMADEEEQAMPALWQAVKEEELERAHTALVASVPPDEKMRVLAWMLPALPARERVGMLAAMRPSLPAPAWEAVLGLARRVLPAAEAVALERALDPGESRVA